MTNRERISVRFPALAPRDFDIFTIPEFAARMGAIRTELRPKLLALGEELALPVGELVSGPIVAHTAAHMRRRTNPPPATWVTFGRSPRGYKRFVHFRVAIHAGGLKVTVHIEDDSDDKSGFAAQLERQRDTLLPLLSAQNDLVWYSPRNGQEHPVTGSGLTTAHLEQMARSLSTLKTADFSAGIPFDREDPRLRSPAELSPLLLDSMRRLVPLYEAALPKVSNE
jgi:uncharacterized protein YktB (UPF0637 family)